MDEKEDDKAEESGADADKVQVEIVDQQPKETDEKDDVKDSWDAESSEDEQEEGSISVQVRLMSLSE